MIFFFGRLRRYSRSFAEPSISRPDNNQEHTPGGPGLAIYRLFEQTVFDPEEIGVIVQAFECALQRLQIADRQGPQAHTLARFVMRSAGEGVQDAETICHNAAQAMQFHRVAQGRFPARNVTPLGSNKKRPGTGPGREDLALHATQVSGTGSSDRP